LVPESDVRKARLRPSHGAGLVLAEGGPEIVAQRDDHGLVGFDPARLKIEIDDRWPGWRESAGTVNRFPRWGDVADLLRLMDLEPAGSDLFVAPIYEDRRRNVVEGSQLLGQ